MKRVWTPEREALLAANYARGVKAAAAAAGVSRSAAVSRAKRLGLSVGTRRDWTPEEDAVLRRDYATATAESIAAALRRGVSSVRNRVWVLNLDRKLPRVPAAVVELVRAGHAAGLTDAEIGRLHAGAIGGPDPRSRVTHVRHVLGLPRDERAVLRRRRQAVRTQLDRLGLRSTSELRPWAFRRYAAECGWPADFRPRAVQVMNLLVERGPMTKREMVAAMGLTWHPRSCKNLPSNSPRGSILADLIAVGFVASQRQFSGTKNGRRGNVYLPTAKAIAWREQHVRTA